MIDAGSGGGVPGGSGDESTAEDPPTEEPSDRESSSEPRNRESSEKATSAAAEEADVADEEALKRAVVTLAESAGVDVPDTEDVERVEHVVSDVGKTVDSLESEVERLDAEIAEVDEAVGSLEADLDEHVADLRERVVQMYREMEAKADGEHDHPELAAAVADAEAAATEAATTADDAAANAGALDERIDGLETHLSEDVDRKLSTVAGALVRAQRRLGKLEHAHARRETLADITAAANRAGTGKAACDSCGNAVRIALLTVPTCPHCEADFGGFEPANGFFGTATLTIGDPPALEGKVAPDSGAELFDDG